jgi:hypothetical protein
MFTTAPHARPSLNCQTGRPRWRACRRDFRDAGARKDDDAGRQDGEELVIALEGRGLRMAVPVRLEGDLGHVTRVGPAGGDAFGAAWRSAMKQHHVADIDALSAASGRG